MRTLFWFVFLYSCVCYVQFLLLPLLLFFFFVFYIRLFYVCPASFALVPDPFSSLFSVFSFPKKNSFKQSTIIFLPSALLHAFLNIFLIHQFDQRCQLSTFDNFAIKHAIFSKRVKHSSKEHAFPARSYEMLRFTKPIHDTK